jgi:hypothetical protein
MVKRVHLTPEEREILLTDIVRQLDVRIEKIVTKHVEKALNRSNLVDAASLVMREEAAKMVNAELRPELERYVKGIHADIDRRYPGKPRWFARFLFH